MNQTTAPTRHQVKQVIQACSHSILALQKTMSWVEAYDRKFGHYPSIQQIIAMVDDFNKGMQSDEVHG